MVKHDYQENALAMCLVVCRFAASNQIEGAPSLLKGQRLCLQKRQKAEKPG